MTSPEAVGSLADANRLLRTEVQRAIALFPNDQGAAIREVLRRSHSIPELQRVLLLHGAYGAVAEALEIGSWMWRRDDELAG
jgi:hypothetical protein